MGGSPTAMQAFINRPYTHNQIHRHRPCRKLYRFGEKREREREPSGIIICLFCGGRIRKYCAYSNGRADALIDTATRAGTCRPALLVYITRTNKMASDTFEKNPNVCGSTAVSRLSVRDKAKAWGPFDRRSLGIPRRKQSTKEISLRAYRHTSTIRMSRRSSSLARTRSGRRF